MPTIDSASLNGLLSSPLALIAGGLAALLVVLVALAIRRTDAARRLLTVVIVLVAAGIGVGTILDRMAKDERAAERRALSQRYTDLAAAALATGSPLACLDGGAGEVVEAACEKAVFAGPQATASAVTYTAARLALLADGLTFARNYDPGFEKRLAGLRRAIELDRFGMVAHLLAARDACTVESCPAFALLRDTSVIKVNLKSKAFDQYVARYVIDWGKTAPVAVQPAPAVPVAAAEPDAAAQAEAPAKAPLPPGFDFPSAASIPPVSIMNPEPPLPKEARDAQAAQPAAASPVERKVPAPPKRPPAHSEPPAAAAPLPLR